MGRLEIPEGADFDQRTARLFQVSRIPMGHRFNEFYNRRTRVCAAQDPLPPRSAERTVGLQRTCRQVRALTDAYPRTSTILIEDAANGTAIIEALTHQVRGIIAVRPEGGKVARAHAVQPQVEAGNVYLPNPRPHGALVERIDIIVMDPAGEHRELVREVLHPRSA